VEEILTPISHTHTHTHTHTKGKYKSIGLQGENLNQHSFKAPKIRVTP